MSKTAWILGLVSLLSAYILNEYNLKYLQEDSILLRKGETVITADDVSYLRPAENFLKTGVYKTNSPGKGSYFLRSPGYPALFICLGTLFEDSKSVLRAAKYFQLLLYSLSVVCLYQIALFYLLSKRWAALGTIIYGITGFSVGFLYYTLTESITPALVIFYIFFLIRAKKETSEKLKYLYYLLSALLFAFLFLTRPVLGILGMALPFFLFADYCSNKKLLAMRLISIGILASSLMVAWQYRNWKLTNQYVGLHPIYYPDESASNFRPVHRAFWDFCKGWGEIGADFHSYEVPFWEACIKGDASPAPVNELIGQLPQNVVAHFGKDRLESVFAIYQEAILYQKTFYDKQIPMPDTIPGTEQEAIDALQTLTQEYKSHFWLSYYVLSPAKVFGVLAFHSNLSLYMFQRSFRGNLLMELWRGICFLLHAGAFCLLLLSLSSKKSHHLKSVFSYSVLCYVFFLVFFQRGIEERYTLPILPLVILSALEVVKSVWQRIYTKVQKISR